MTNEAQSTGDSSSSVSFSGAVAISQVTPGTTNAVAPISGQAGVDGNTGTVSAKTQRVVLATDVALPAGENFLGSVGGKTVKMAFAPTTSSTAYTANDNIGGIITLSNALRVAAGTGILDSISLWALANQKPNLYIDFWNASPSGTYTNDSAQVIAGDQLKWMGMAEVAITDWKDTGVISRCSVRPVNFGLAVASGRDIYMTIQDKTGITLSSTAGLFGYATILQD